MSHATRGRSRLPGPINVPEPYPPHWKFDIDRPKLQADPPDDDFVGGVLDPKWTVVDGSLGTCSLTYGGGDRYDVTSRDSWLLMQADNGNHVELRQDYELPDGHSIVLKIAPTPMASGESGITNNNVNTGIWLNDNDGGPESGNWVHMIFDTNTNAWRILYNNQAGSAKSTPSGTGITGAPAAGVVYLRILRATLTYYGYWSTDGETWFPLASFTYGSALTNIWICARGNASIGDPTPIQAVDWIRLGGSGIDPW